MNKARALTIVTRPFVAPLAAILSLSAQGRLPRRIFDLWTGRDWVTRPASNRLFRDGILARTNGEPFWMPYVTASYCDTYEERSIELLKQAIRPGMTFVDVGANIGYFAVMASRMVGPSGKVYAVEPSPKSIALLEKNLALHKASNVTVLKVGAGDKTATMTLQLTAEQQNDSLFAIPAYSRAIGTTEVQIERLDTLISTADMVKMDVQGFEIEALDGMTGIIERSPGLKFLVEWHAVGLEAAGHDPEELLDWFLSHGLTIAGVIDDHAGEFITIGEARRRMKSNPLRWYGNILAESRGS